MSSSFRAWNCQRADVAHVLQILKSLDYSKTSVDVIEFAIHSMYDRDQIAVLLESKVKNLTAPAAVSRNGFKMSDDLPCHLYM